MQLLEFWIPYVKLFLTAWQIGRNSTSCYRLQKIANYNSRTLHIAILSMIGLGSNQSGLHHYCDRVETWNYPDTQVHIHNTPPGKIYKTSIFQLVGGPT